MLRLVKNLVCSVQPNLIVGFILVASALYGQSPFTGNISGGLVAPIGKSLQHSYAVGFEIGAGMQYRLKNVFVGLNGTAEIYLNRPPSASSIADQLVLFGPTVQAGYSIPIGSRSIEPFLGIGYTWGVNSINDGSLFSDNSQDLLTVKGISFGPGFRVRINDQAAISLSYTLYSPPYTLTQAAHSAISSFSTPTLLYGPITNIPSGSMEMDRLIIRFNWTF